MSRRPALAALLLLLCLLALAGCGSGDGGEPTSSGEQSTAGERARPEVIVETVDRGFDAAARLPRGLARRGHDPLDLRRQRRRGRGLRLRPQRRRRNRHQRPRRHRRIRAASREPAKEVFVEFPDRNVVDAEIVGFDPFADVALLKVEPDGFALHPLELGDDSELQVGQPVAAIGSPFGEQQSLSSRHRLRHRPLGQIADPVPDRGRDPDRRLDQPRQLGRAAARRRRPRARHQRADRDQLRLQLRGRLRGPDLRDQAIGRPVAGRRQRRIRLHRRLQPGALPAAGGQARARHHLRRPARRSRLRRPRREGRPARSATRNCASRPANTAPAATSSSKSTATKSSCRTIWPA